MSHSPLLGRIMLKILLFPFLCFPLLCAAQNNKIQFGASIPVFLKANTDIGAQVKSPVFLASGLELALMINGTEERSMSFMPAVGIFGDNRSFTTEKGSHINTTLYFINIHPSVLIASKWDNIKYSIGIGALVNIGNGVSVSSNSNSSGTFYTDPDTIGKKLNNNGRNIIPFVSLGATCTINKHFMLQAVIQPTLLNYEEPGTTLKYTISYKTQYISLSYQPVYFGFRIFYFL